MPGRRRNGEIDLKRWIVSLLIAAALLALALPVSALYTDEEKLAANKAAVAYAAEKGMIDADAAPKETISRAEAAKIVCAALEETPDALTKVETGFSDVPAAHAMAKYVAYCADRGLILDAKDGRFDPDGRQSAVGLARMLLVAFGFAKAEDLTGGDWIVQTQKALRPHGLNWYLDTVADRPVTRENACQLAYNVRCNADLAKIEPEAYKEVTIPFTDPGKYKLLGRALQTEDGVICDWSGDGVEFKIVCKGMISLTASTTYVPISYHAFRVIVDGKAADWMQLKRSGVRTCPMVVNLPAGEHTIRVLKDSPVAQSTDMLRSLTLTCKPETMQPTPKKERFIEIIGDSTSQGAGAYMPTDDMRTTHMTSSAVLCYGYLAAEALDMDYELLVKGSMGLLFKTGSPIPYNYMDMYEYQNRYRDHDTKFTRWRKADVICIKIGGNDGNKFPEEEWYTSMKTFLQTIRIHHGESVPIIIFTYGGTANYVKAAQRVIDEDPFVSKVIIKANAGGAGGHPSKAAQERFAKQLIEAVQALDLK